ncbi:hypothetical protein D3C84_444020 [compost metagenome]
MRVIDWQARPLLDAHTIRELVTDAGQRLDEIPIRLQFLQRQPQLPDHLGQAVVGHFQTVLAPCPRHQIAFAHHGTTGPEQHRQATAGDCTYPQGLFTRGIKPKQEEIVFVEYQLFINQHEAHSAFPYLAIQQSGNSSLLCGL